MELLVQKYLREKGLAALTEELKIKATRHKKCDSLVLFKYDQIESPRAHPIVIECRGLILDEADDWRVVSFPYRRFFNFGEGHAAEIDWTTARVYEKVDGSLISLWFYSGEWHASTSGSPDASGPVNNDSSMTFADLFWKTWNDLGYRLPYPPETDEERFTYLFELMTPHNRVIVPHAQSRIVFHGIRSLDTFQEYDPANVDAQRLGWEIIKSFPIQTVDDVVKACNALNPMEQEGFIICDGNFQRVKVKSPQYIALAHMKDGFSDRRMLDLVRTNEGSEFLSYFPSYKPLYDKIKGKYDALVANAEALYEEIKGIEGQKDFALKATKTKASAALFAVRNGKVKTIRDYFSNASIGTLEKLLGL